MVLAGGAARRAVHPGVRHEDGHTGVHGLPQDLAITKTLDRMEAAFPGGPLPLTVVMKADVLDPKTQTAIEQLKFAALSTG